MLLNEVEQHDEYDDEWMFSSANNSQSGSYASVE
jgi:hypothetical protein